MKPFRSFYLENNEDKFFPSEGSHEKGKAMELIQLYRDLTNSEQDLSQEIWDDTLREKWTKVILDPGTNEDQVLNFISDQSDVEGLHPGTVPRLFAAYRDAKGAQPV